MQPYLTEPLGSSKIISNKTLVTAAVEDTVLIGDASDSNNLKKATVQTIVDLVGASGSVAVDAIFDAAGDLPVGSGANTAVRMARGGALFILQGNSGGTNIEWEATSGTGNVVRASAASAPTAFIELDAAEYAIDPLWIYVGNDDVLTVVRNSHTETFYLIAPGGYTWSTGVNEVLLPAGASMTFIKRPVGVSTVMEIIADIVPQIQQFEVDSVADLIAFAGVPDGKLVTLLGYYVPGDGGGQMLIYRSTGRPVANNGVYFNGPGADDYFESANKYVLNVMQFGAVPEDGTDDTPFIQAAIDYCKSFSTPETERDLLWPGGTYRVTSLDYTNCNRVVNRSLGGVKINGTSIGGTSIIDLDNGGAGTYRICWEGEFTIQIATGGGATYQYGFYANGIVDSRVKLSVSGSYSVNTVYLDVCYDNPQLDFTASNSSGAAIETIKCGANNNNHNNFFVRTTGVTPPNNAIASVGFHLTGNANIISGDFSSSQIGLILAGSRGTVVKAGYFEQVKTCIKLINNAVGTAVLGGSYEVSTDGSAFDLNSSEQTTIVGGYIYGNVEVGQTNRTAFAMGSACYGLNVLNTDVLTSGIEQAYTGTWQGLVGGYTRQLNAVCAQWVGFPPTQISSTDVNTLDDYKEGSWTPAGNTITLAFASGKYTKIGNIVHVFFEIVFPGAGGVNNAPARITGLPYSASTSYRNGAALGLSTNPGMHTLFALESTLYIYNNAGAERLNNDCTDNQYYGTLTYRVDA